MRAKSIAGVVLVAACGGIIGPVPPIVGDMSAEQPSSVVGGPPGTLFSLVDNPEIETIFSLPADHTVSGAPVNFEVQGFRASHVANTYYGDLLVHLVGGDGSPNTDGTIGAFLGAVNGTLVPWPNSDADFFPPANANLFARGIRIGYRPLKATTVATLADDSTVNVSTGTIQLDPSVLLVPIEVVVATSPSFANNTGLGTIAAQLSLWDQWQPVTNFVQSSAPDHSIVLTSRTLPQWRDPFQTSSWISGGTVGLYSGVVGGYFTPDSVWRSCGVQFRLRNFFTIATDDVHNDVTPSGPFSTPNGPCADLKQAVLADPRHVPGIPIVIFVFRENLTGFENAVEIDNHTCSGAPALDATACVPISGSGPVLAHELGHMSCLDDCDCVNDPNCHMMCSTDAVPPPSVGDCQSMRNFAGNYSNLWPR